MTAMTDKEVEEAVEHDVKLFLESWKEQGLEDFDDQREGQVAAVDARLRLFEACVNARIQAVRADLMRWTLLVFCIAALSVALIVRI